MIYKNSFLSTVLTLCTFTSGINASESTTPDFNEIAIESNQTSAFKVAADSLIEVAKIVSEQRIEAAKIKAEAEIIASENYGLEAARRWGPIIGAAICIFAAINYVHF